MKINTPSRSRLESALTLAELVLCTAISAVTIASSMVGYVQSAKRAEFAAYSLAANSLSQQRIEQARACQWDTLANPAVDLLVSTNFPVRVEILDIPIAGTNIVYATNFTTITTLSTNPWLKSIRVDCVWRFVNGRITTNTTMTYRAPDQ
jgi:type II secretory pathway pseudopilin PulG